MPNFAILRVQRLKSKSDLDGGTRHGRREDTGTHFDPERTPFNEHYGATRVVGPVDWADAVEWSATRLGAVFRSGATKAAEFFVGASPEYFAPREGEPFFNMDRVYAFRDGVLAAFYERFGERVVLARLDLDEGTPHVTIVVLPVYEKKTKHKTQLTVSYREEFGGQNRLEARAKLIELQDWIARKLEPIGLVRGVSKAVTGREHLTHHQYARRRRIEDEARKTALEEAEQRVADLRRQNEELEVRLTHIKAQQEQTTAYLRAAAEHVIDAEKAHHWLAGLQKRFIDLEPNAPVVPVLDRLLENGDAHLQQIAAATEEREEWPSDDVPPSTPRPK